MGFIITYNNHYFWILIMDRMTINHIVSIDHGSHGQSSNPWLMISWGIILPAQKNGNYNPFKNRECFMIFSWSSIVSWFSEFWLRIYGMCMYIYIYWYWIIYTYTHTHIYIYTYIEYTHSSWGYKPTFGFPRLNMISKFFMKIIYRSGCLVWYSEDIMGM